MIKRVPALSIVAWEITSRCNLSCLHCRASSTNEIGLFEFTTDEAKSLCDQMRELGSPMIILSGGEPLLRDDIFSIAKYASSSGMRVVLATNGTLVTRDVARDIKKSGIKRVSVSLDGHDEKSHDSFRGVDGAFSRSLAGIEALKSEGVEFQINTTITKRNLEEIELIYSLCLEIGAKAHHIFLLVPTGRAKEHEFDLLYEDIVLDAKLYEDVLSWFCEKMGKDNIELKATCAPQIWRICKDKLSYLSRRAKRGCLAGISFCFISSCGEVKPCGYLDVICGDLRKETFSDIWSNSEVFCTLRDYSNYKGKCGFCEFRYVCGGCRARAYEMKGDFLEEEPLCTYRPSSKRDSD